ncbi:carbohydrate sulfotransferase 15-like [Dreissena polymorpha]|nr:carbohydrate sulfotransferase 15-like [Dreissena polymorpha]
MFIIGVKKCGTSDLFFRTAMHPDFAHPGFKEAQWFARRRFTKDKSMADFSAYISMFDKAANKVYKGAELMPHESFTNQRTITGEASPSNLHLNSHWQTLPGNENADEPRYVILDYIHHILPAAKIIITFRDPIDRLYSDYFHEFGTLQNRNDVGPAHFHEVVTEGIDLYRKCFEHRTVRSCAYDHSLYDTTKMQVQLGIYYIYWQELTRLFSRDNILVLQNKDMKYKERTMKMVYNFLGLRELTAVEMQSVVKSQEQYIRKASYKEKGPMLKETRELLTEFYQPFNEKMAELTGDSQFLYMDTS